jgi:BlaI family penicillinase repressor
LTGEEVPVASVVPTERELQLLKILWDRGESTVRDVCEAMTLQGHRLAYTTVLTLLQTMEQKSLVGHTAQGKTYSYFAKVNRESTFRSLARGFLDSVFDGALDEYVLHALDARKISPAELERLEAMLAEAKKKSRRKS